MMKPDNLFPYYCFISRHYIMKFYTCHMNIPELNNSFLFLQLTFYKKKSCFLNTIWYKTFPVVTIQYDCTMGGVVLNNKKHFSELLKKNPSWNLKPVAEIKPRLIFSAWMSLFWSWCYLFVSLHFIYRLVC